MMGRLFRTELIKQFRRPRTYVVLGMAALVPVIVAIAVKANPPPPPGSAGGRGFGGGGDEGPLAFLAEKSGLLTAVFGLQVMSGFMLVIFVALFGGDTVAAEASSGNLRALLTRPVRRGHLLAAKLTSAALLAFAATLIVVAAGLLAGGAAFGWHALDVPQLGLHESVGRVLADLGLATLYVWWCLGTVVTLAFMVSTMTDAPATAMFAGVGGYFITRILDAISALGSLRDVLPTHYTDAWTNLFTGASASDMLTGALVQVPYMVGFSAIGWWWFRRKDILS